ncbi:hypothetical protein NMY22_g2928 [Coprinellus aureogranulatus]|nr:hypothetical protein NMY22_g2928 [Coprinellus aureogranulatus]
MGRQSSHPSTSFAHRHYHLPPSIIDPSRYSTLWALLSVLTRRRQFLELGEAGLGFERQYHGVITLAHYRCDICASSFSSLSSSLTIATLSQVTSTSNLSPPRLEFSRSLFIKPIWLANKLFARNKSVLARDTEIASTQRSFWLNHASSNLQRGPARAESSPMVNPYYLATSSWGCWDAKWRGWTFTRTIRASSNNISGPVQSCSQGATSRILVRIGFFPGGMSKRAGRGEIGIASSHDGQHMQAPYPRLLVLRPRGTALKHTSLRGNVLAVWRCGGGRGTSLGIFGSGKLDTIDVPGLLYKSEATMSKAFRFPASPLSATLRLSIPTGSAPFTQPRVESSSVITGGQGIHRGKLASRKEKGGNTQEDTIAL